MLLNDPYLSFSIVVSILLGGWIVDYLFPILEILEEKEVEQPVLYDEPEYTGSYSSPLWPSPRPLNFAKSLAIFKGRLNHKGAIDFLAKHAEISVDEFLKVNPLTYLKVYMPNTDPYTLLDSRSQDELTIYLNREKLIESIRLVG
jgi:hypothetical protein